MTTPGREMASGKMTNLVQGNTSSAKPDASEVINLKINTEKNDFEQDLTDPCCFRPMIDERVKELLRAHFVDMVAMSSKQGESLSSLNKADGST